jgi:serine phosphatase RsbU (regulator of sigma subunit)
MNYSSIRYFFLVFTLVFVKLLSAQIQLPEDVERQIKHYKNTAIKNRNAGNDNAAASYLNKIAFLYWEYYDYNHAIKHFEEVMTINMDNGNKHGEQKVFENIAMVYSDMERYDKSIEFFEKSLVLLKEKGNKKLICQGENNIAVAYNNNGQYKEAIERALKGLEKSKEINDIKLMRSFHGVLYESYDKIGDKEKSIEHFNLYSSFDKHIQQELFAQREKENRQKLSEMETQKDKAITERDEKATQLEYTKDTLKQVEQISKEQQLAIDILNKDKEIKELTIQQQEAKLKSERTFRIGLIAIFILVSVFSGLLFKQVKAKNKANNKLQQLYGELEKKNHQILDSIKYASHIQEAILPYEKSLKEQLPGSFIFYLPRDIVSGDFYWYGKYENMVFLAAIDCTGHGVPGAFMSMIGNTLLNEIVNENKVHKPSEVLKLLNDKVEVTLNQGNGNDQEGFSEDGMDISFLCYHKDKNVVELALANHSACVFKNGKKEIVEGDFFSIGGNVGGFEVSYTNHSIPIDQDTNIYMFSDGFPDQFGGLKKQKYRSNRFMDFLQSIQSFEFARHASMIEQEYNTWKGDQRQIDDVLVIGLQLKK